MEATCRGGYEGGDACATWIDGLRENRARGAEGLDASALTERVYEDAFIMITDLNTVQRKSHTKRFSTVAEFFHTMVFRSTAVTTSHYLPKYIH